MPLLDALVKAPGLEPAVQKSFQREQLSELTLPLATSLMEGGFIAVVAAKSFNVEPWVIAVIAAAPMFGNLSSYFWNMVAAGRPKVPMISVLQVLALLCVLAIALSPRNAFGNAVLLVSVVTCRVLIAGIMTMRSVVWSLNYERAMRARITGRLQAITSLMVVVVTGLGGVLLDLSPQAFRFVFGGAAVMGLAGVWAFRGVTVQREARQLVLERRGNRKGSSRNSFFYILRNDPLYARYQLHQFTSGAANMMLEPPLVFLLSKQMNASYTESITITMLIPFSLAMATMPFWARYLDRVHVAEFRARQNALWVVGVLFMFVGAWQLSLWWLAIGRILTGIVNGGGNLAWQLGHNDFAPKDQLAAYMSIHVTLTGVRGAFAPFLGMALYLGWSGKSYVPGSDGLGHWTFLVAVVMGLLAWRGFDRLRRDIAGRPSPRLG